MISSVRNGSGGGVFVFLEIGYEDGEIPSCPLQNHCSMNSAEYNVCVWGGGGCINERRWGEKDRERERKCCCKL